MTRPTLAQLRAIAEKATQPSPWTVEVDSAGARILDDNGCWVAEAGEAPLDAAHIAAFHPAQAIALIDEIEQLRAQVDGAGSEPEACQRALDSLASIKKEIG